MAHNPYHIVRTQRQLANQRRRRLLESVEVAATPPAADGYDFGTDGDAVVATYTDGSGGTGGTGLAPILDNIDNASRRLSGLDFSPDGLNVVCTSYSAIVATYSLTQAFDLSTATVSGTHITSQTLATNPRFSEDGSYVTWQASDLLKIASLGTAYTVNGETPSAATLTKTEMLGYSASHDPVHALHPDGTGVFSFGQVSAGVYTVAWMPLSSAYDFSTNGTVVASTTDYGNIVASPTTGTVVASDDGTRVQVLAGGATDTMHNYELASAFTPDGTETETTSTEVNMTQDHDMCAWSKDFAKIILLDGPFTPSVRVFNQK